MTQSKKSYSVYLMMLAMLGLSVSCHASLTGGYMQVASDGLVYLRIAQVGNKLNGYMQIIQADLSAMEGFTTKQVHVTGEVSDASFSLH